MSAFLIDIVVAVAVTAGGWLVGSWLEGAARVSLERTGVDPAVRHLIARMVRPLAVVVALIAALYGLGLDLSPAVALLGASALAVGLALRGSLSNVASGAILLTLRPYAGGDFVEVGGQAGTVVAFDLLTVTIKSPDGVLITLPNDSVFRGAIKNFTRNGLRRIDVPFVLTHDSDAEAALATLEALVASDEAVLSEPAPVVRVDQIGLEGVRVIASAWVRTADFGPTRARLLRTSLQSFDGSPVHLARLRSPLHEPA